MTVNKIICLDISDLINFSRFSNCVSGIQRVVLELAKEFQNDNRVKFVFLDHKEGVWREVRGINFSSIENLDVFKKNCY